MNSKQGKEFIKALDALVAEKGIDKAIAIEAMEAGMANAYKRNTGVVNVKAKVNSETGQIRLFTFKNVVEEVEEGKEDEQISLDDAKKIVDDIEVGETIDTEVKIIPEDFGRVAVLSAKQIIVQKVKEAEKNLINEEFKDKQDEILIGTLSREDSKNYYVDLGRAHGVLPKDEIIPGEKLEMGSSIKVYVSKIEFGTKGLFILLSRSHYGFVKRLLESEIPELSDGTVMLYSVARDAGNRSKIAVYSEYDKVDPVGAIIGERGSRINRVLNQLNGEKIDVILYDKDPVKFIQNALSPAKDVEVRIVDEKSKEAVAIVNDENSSLAIGKKGQNVKLASRLTKYKIAIKKVGELDEE
ncbi:MAG: transcription termination factor NusA [Erysipelotrichaceae bacterium]|nr:transcription termination factor NusA [Erysipelotrichaceae bacterium]MDD6093446.1 transcription termination factor NusA [bacterium]MDY3934885.1 transcription termination factor NusA [Bacilli bacterium]